MKSDKLAAEEWGGGSAATHVIVTCDLYHPAYLLLEQLRLLPLDIHRFQSY